MDTWGAVICTLIECFHAPVQKCHIHRVIIILNVRYPWWTLLFILTALWVKLLPRCHCANQKSYRFRRLLGRNANNLTAC